jgi:hypothetical protein
MPACSMRRTNESALPSRIGISPPSTSAITLSIAARGVARKCSQSNLRAVPAERSGQPRFDDGFGIGRI